jgi:hypothetical protein
MRQVSRAADTHQQNYTASQTIRPQLSPSSPWEIQISKTLSLQYILHDSQGRTQTIKHIYQYFGK